MIEVVVGAAEVESELEGAGAGTSMVIGGELTLMIEYPVAVTVVGEGAPVMV